MGEPPDRWGRPLVGESLSRSNPSVADPILRSAAQISGITLLARAAGFARWIVLGVAVGTTYLGNVYQTANFIPNVVFELLAGGMLSAVLVPTFVSEIHLGQKRVSEIASTLANALLIVSVPLVIVGLIFARPIMEVMLSGVADPAVRDKQVELGAWFLRFFLPQVPLYLLGMVMQGVLHAHRRFVAAALGPLLSSLTVIATYLVFRAMGPAATLDVARSRLLVLALGTTLGVFVLTFCQVPSVLRLGIRWRAQLSYRDPVVRRAMRAGLWGAVFVGLLQALLLVVVVLANRVEGGVVAFQIANAFFELPNAIVGLPIALSLFPVLSEAFSRRDEKRFARVLADGWNLSTFVAVPAGVALYFLAAPASDALLGWSSIARPELVTAVLQGLAIGVPPWVLLATIVRAFYARGATARPALLYGLAFAVVVVVGLGGTAVTDVTGTAALRLLGIAVGAGWWLAVIVGFVLLVSLAREWSVIRSLRSVTASVARGAVLGFAVWLTLRLVGDGSSALALGAATAVGLAVIAGLGSRSAELRATIALAVKGETPEDDA